MDEVTTKPHAPTCGCPHHKIVPLGILVAGAAYLLTAFSITTEMFANIVIGIALVAIGGVKLNEGKCKCC